MLLAAALRPWRVGSMADLPWPWLAWWAVMPLLWSLDLVAGTRAAQPMSGACLLVLMMGWPLAVLALLPVAALTALATDLTLADALSRYVWLGLVPMSLALGLGALVRRWLPHHLFIYILGRGFIGTALAITATGALALIAQHKPDSLDAEEWMQIGRAHV